MMSEYNTEISLLMELLVEHIIDVELNYKEKIELFKYLYSTDTFEENSFEWYAKSYFLTKVIKGKRFSAIVLYNKDKRHILINRGGSDGSETWVNAEPEDIHDISHYIREKYSIKESEYNELVGFISFESKQSHYVFKIKNEILREEKYTKENTTTMVNQELCTLQEFTMRYFNKIRKNGKIWFLDTELAMIYNF